MFQRVFVLLISITIAPAVSAQEKSDTTVSKHENKGFVDLNGYYDTRDFSVFTVNLLAILPNRFQYFSFTNYQSSAKSADLENFYSEQNLRWKISDNSPFDLTHQMVIRQGDVNDDFRFGVRWRVNNTPKLKSFFKKINMSYALNPMLIDFRKSTEAKYMTAIEHVYRINVLPKVFKNRVYVGGFADQNFIYNNNKLSFKWVSEHQLGVRVLDQLYLILEYRINDFLPTDNYGLGYGLEYKIKF